MAQGSGGGSKGAGGGKVVGGAKGGGRTTRGYGPPGGWPSTVPGVPSGGNRGNAAPKR